MLSRIFKSKWLWLILLIGCTCCLFLALLCAISPLAPYFSPYGWWRVITGDRWTRENPHPFPKGLPAQPIVFMPDADPVVADADSKSLGFMYPDGTGRIEYTLELYENARSMWGTKIKDSHALFPRWSPKGDLVFSIAGPPPNVRLIDSRGRMYGEECNSLRGGVINFDPQGNILGMIYESSPLYRKYQDYAQEGTVLVARHDLRGCRIVGVLLLPVAVRGIGSVSESSQGWITGSFYDPTAGVSQVLLYHPGLKVKEVFPGTAPSFSDDGLWLAYYRPDGYLVVRSVTGGNERVITKVIPYPEDWLSYVSMPGWSPDGQWIVYNTPDGKIYKVHRESGEKVYLGYGWAPDWR